MDPKSTTASWHIPHISISTAPPEEVAIEPYSPFSFAPAASSNDGTCTVESRQLKSPPTFTTSGSSQILRSLGNTYDAGTMRQKRSEAPFRGSTAGSAPISVTKASSLRKNIASTMKAQVARRRAVFLSRMFALPSPTAAVTPKTPPDSPAIFHYTLPSPGLVSPLTLLESLGRNSTDGTISHTCKPWVEQVDFRSYKNPLEADSDNHPCDAAPDHRGMPSLDQISARMNSHGRACTSVSAKRATRLPAFLTSPHTPVFHDLSLAVDASHLGVSIEPSKSHITVPALRPASVSLQGLSESTFRALDTRARRAHDMLSMLKRRTGLPGHRLAELDERSRKRFSAPADLLPFHERDGFKHPVLFLPGGF